MEGPSAGVVQFRAKGDGLCHHKIESKPFVCVEDEAILGEMIAALRRCGRMEGIPVQVWQFAERKKKE